MFKSNPSNFVRAVLLCSLGLPFLGCGGPGNVAKVSGTVTLDGQPLEGAVVRFEPLAGDTPSGAITDATGKYVLTYTREYEGAEIGEHRVKITTGSRGDPDSTPPTPRRQEKLPKSYHSQTELKAEVKAGANVLDFPLQSSGAAPGVAGSAP